MPAGLMELESLLASLEPARGNGGRLTLAGRVAVVGTTALVTAFAAGFEERVR